MIKVYSWWISEPYQQKWAYQSETVMCTYRIDFERVLLSIRCVQKAPKILLTYISKQSFRKITIKSKISQSAGQINRFSHFLLHRGSKRVLLSIRCVQKAPKILLTYVSEQSFRRITIESKVSQSAYQFNRFSHFLSHREQEGLCELKERVMSNKRMYFLIYSQWKCQATGLSCRCGRRKARSATIFRSHDSVAANCQRFSCFGNACQMKISSQASLF